MIKTVKKTAKEGKNIVMLSLFDYAAAGLRIARAVNKYTKHKVDHIVLTDHGNRFQMPRNVCLTNIKLSPIGDGYRLMRTDQANWESIEQAKNLIQNADIIHYKGDEPPSVIWSAFDQLLKMRSPRVPIISSVEGSKFRRRDDYCNKQSALAIWPMRMYMSAAIRTTLTPDINYPEFKGVYTPQAIDCDQMDNEWFKHDHSKTKLISHAPSSRIIKGTDTFLAAMNKLASEYPEAQLNLIEKLSHKECLRRTKQSYVLFEQCVVGAYGYAGLEAMSYGIPTLVWVSDRAVDQSSGRFVREELDGIINVLPNPDDIYYTLLSLIHMDLTDVSKCAKDWVHKHHSYASVANIWNDIYSGL